MPRTRSTGGASRTPSAPAFAAAADTCGGPGGGLRVVSAFARLPSSRCNPISRLPPLRNKCSAEKTGQWSNSVGNPGPSLSVCPSPSSSCHLRVARGWLAAQWAQWTAALLPQPAAWLCDCVRVGSGLRPSGRRPPSAPRVAVNL